MRDYDGEEKLRTEHCKMVGVDRCENMQEVGGGMEGERYRCAVCGATYWLDYEDMK
jgi:transposase-like protein